MNHLPRILIDCLHKHDPAWKNQPRKHHIYIRKTGLRVEKTYFKLVLKCKLVIHHFKLNMQMYLNIAYIGDTLRQEVVRIK